MLTDLKTTQRDAMKGTVQMCYYQDTDTFGKG